MPAVNEDENAPKDEEETPTREEQKESKEPDAKTENPPEIIKPQKPAQLKDLNFFAFESPKKVAVKRKRKKVKSSYHDDDASSSESSSESVDDSEETLRKIFEDYDPASVVEAVGDDVVGKEFTDERSAKTTADSETESGSASFVETVGVGSLKKRIAHSAKGQVRILRPFAFCHLAEYKLFFNIYWLMPTK